MNIKKSILTLSLSTFLAFSMPANASKLPNDVWNYVKEQLPLAQQRFDSVVVLDDDVMYIPLYPPTDTSVEELKIEYTYPENKTLKEKPEVVLLNNGYSFLKVFKDEKGNYTLTKKDDLPIKVRLGLMPQDMLTPMGLKMPESLKLTLGDLLIPSKEETSLALKEEEKEKAPSMPNVKNDDFIQSAEFKNKKTFINPRNSKFLSVYDNSSQKPLYELKLSSMPLKIISSDKSNVALVLYWSGKNIEIIDLKEERIITTIELDSSATDVVLNKKENIAYVTSQNANSIYLINLNSMQLDRVIKLSQKPTKIAYCELDDTISFFDEYSQKIFNITRNLDEYIVQPMGEVKNVSKIVTDVANIYAISRTHSELSVFDKVQGKLLTTVLLDKKPTDAILYGTKLFILCAKEGYMDVYDTTKNKLISRERLSDEGFYSKMTLIPGENNVIITGINAKTYLIYNLETMKLAQIQDSYINVSNIVIMDKAQRL